MAKFRKKPVVIEAMQFTDETKNQVFNFVRCNCYAEWDAAGNPTLKIQTIEGDMMAHLGDWIIKGVKNEFYPCKNNIFLATYEAVEKNQPMPNGKLDDTLAHIEKVLINMLDIIANLTERASVHDASKLEEPELSGYVEMQKAFTGKEYGTLEYKAVIELFKPIVQHHYEHNTHHPEHWPNGITDMSLLDVVEMLADWRAASDRRGDDLGKGIDYSVRRFGISDQLASILTNTAIELGWTKRDAHAE